MLPRRARGAAGALTLLLAALLLTLTPAVAPNKTPLVRVFVLPHTHDDPGWQQTIDEYYNPYTAPDDPAHDGIHYGKYHYGVKAIYDNVTALLSEPTPAGRNRTFIVVETLFFSMWWEDPATSNAQRCEDDEICIKNEKICIKTRKIALK